MSFETCVDCRTWRALKRAPIEVATIAARAVEMVTSLYEQRGHSLVVDIPVVGLSINADDHRFTPVDLDQLSRLISTTARRPPPRCPGPPRNAAPASQSADAVRLFAATAEPGF
jgi:hypothetical protein